MRVLSWHVHGSWSTAFVQGPNTYLVPVTPDRGPDGRGRAQTWDWPATVEEVCVEDLGDLDFDIAILQRPAEIALLEEWTGRRPGIDVPAVYLEHNCPAEHPVSTRHAVADRSDIALVHVTHFNRLVWDNGIARTRVIEHGIIDPGYRWIGDLPHSAVVVNEPLRRHRITGTDLLERFTEAGPVDVFGFSADGLHDRYGLDPERVRVHGNVVQEQLHGELARRRVYVHTSRWTSLGLSLLEAMHVGMPVVAVGATEAHRAVPPGVGRVSADIDELVDAVREYQADWSLAQRDGMAARTHALAHYGLPAFLEAWQSLLEEEAA